MKRKSTHLLTALLCRPFLILALFSFTCTGLRAQRNCGSGINLAEMRSKDPARYQRFMELEAFTQKYIQTAGQGGTGAERLINTNTSVITIPVVVHILWNNAAQNITDAQVQTQIAVLNEDFRRLNADRFNTPAAFQPVASDVQVEFRLACVDPNGNATTGITRTFTNKTIFTVNSSGPIDEVATGIKYTSQGGRDAWATSRYLNIWVANIELSGGGTLFGYSQFPADYATKPNTDGVVCRFNVFGRLGSAVAPFNRGRTATHEVGHWMNLFHIWGDALCGDDQVGDTPTQITSTLGCPTGIVTSCSNGPNGEMYMNYMDYTVDACMNIFTTGQRARMRAVFTTGGPRESFINNYFTINQPACNPTVITLKNPTCLPVTWSVTGPVTITTEGNNQIGIAPTGAGGVVCSVTATAGGYTDTRNFVIGPPPAIPSPITMQRIGTSCYYQPVATISAGDYLTGTVEFSTNGITWTTGTKISGNKVKMDVDLEGPGSFTFRCRIRNACGAGPVAIRTLTIPSPPPGCMFISRPAPAPQELTEMRLYPNPAGNWLQIALPGGASQATVRIVDAGGRVVKLATIGQAPARLNIAALKAGLYFVQLSLPDGRHFKANFSKL